MRRLIERVFLFLPLAAALLAFRPSLQAADPSAAAAGAFDARVAPVLARRCLECHNGSQREGGLDLTRRATALAGGDSGAALVPGKLDESYLWQRVSAGEMPPEDREPVSAEERAILEQWIAAGAAWGSDPIDRFRYTTDKRAGRDWWAFQPIRRPELPAVKDAAWPRNEIDHFILARLEAAGLSPSPEADRRTLVRRLHFDLVGLPPTPEEVAAFVADESPDAYEKLVDRLLESPHYSERWARHWLDVVRFGESQGFQRNWLRPEAWKYRDWVILALNEDMPYDEFVRRQIAGDLLYPDDPPAIAATGYLVAGTYNLEGDDLGSPAMKRQFRQEELADNVATLGQTFLGLTIHCARCHDHKFDPIPQREYYQVASTLAMFRHNGSDPRDVDGLPESAPERRALRERIEPLRARMAEIEGDLRATLLAEATAAREQALAEAAAEAEQTGQAYVRAIADAGVRYVDTVTGLPVPDPNRGLPYWRGLFLLGWPLVAAVAIVATFSLSFVRRLVDRVARPLYAALILLALGLVATVRGAFLPDESPEKRFLKQPVVTNEVNQAKRANAYAEIALANLKGSPPSVDDGEVLDRLPPAARGEYARLVREASELEMREALLAGGPMYAVVPDQPAEPLRVLEMGNIHRPAEEVAPAGVAALGEEIGRFGLPADAPDAARRTRLAEWLTDPANPLTARVIVNRVWHHHFGRGIVATPNDFGFKGARPTHPELLDWLASEFAQDGTRLKALHRKIVASAAYRQSSSKRPEAVAVDADDRLVWRHEMRRHDAETLRDAVLATAGALNPRMGGPGYRDFLWRQHHPENAVFDVYEPLDPFNGRVNRRSIYRTAARSANNTLLTAFDCADPTISTPARPATTTPLQALSLLNNPFMERAAERFAERVAREGGSGVESQVPRAYRLAYQREPGPEEAASAAEYVERFGLPEFCLLIFNTNEFLHVD